jgi:hypothetical protein
MRLITGERSNVATVDVVDTCEFVTTEPAVMSYSCANAAFELEVVARDTSNAKFCVELHPVLNVCNFTDTLPVEVVTDVVPFWRRFFVLDAIVAAPLLYTHSGIYISVMPLGVFTRLTWLSVSCWKAISTSLL